MAIDRFGSPSVLKLHTVSVPALGPREVLVAIDTAGVGSWDVKERAGDFGPASRFPLILGSDCSGIVVARGSQERRIRLGDRVFLYSYDNPKGGCYAEYVAVASSRVARIPAGLDMLHAGAIPSVALTALQGVDDALHLKAHETIVIHGASGGVGSMAVQFARRRKATVVAVASGRDGVSFVRRLGADFAIDGNNENVSDEIARVAPDGVDAVLGYVGGTELEQCIDSLRRGGRVAYPNGVNPIPRKRRGIKFTAYDAKPGVREFIRLERAIKESRLIAPIAAEFLLEQAADAHRRIEKGHVLGKVVLRIGGR